MAKQIITGDEPYYPIIGDTNWHVTSGITIRQKFIADWMIQNDATWRRESGSLEAAAQDRFESYLRIINQEDK